MTVAVCFKCGEFKFGAFSPCQSCGVVPATEDDLAYSLAMTDHYFKEPTLKQMGDAIRNGTPPNLDPTTKAKFIKEIRTMPGLIRRSGTEQKKPWWRFW